MGETAARIGARFVISAGDNFYEDGVAGVGDPKWRTSFEEVYVHRALQVPWHVALGNHDYHGDTDAQIAYSKVSPRWRLPARWHVRRELAPDGTSLDLFFLDTSPFISSYWKRGAREGEGRRAEPRCPDRLARARARRLARGLEGRRRPPSDLVGRRFAGCAGHAGEDRSDPQAPWRGALHERSRP